MILKTLLISILLILLPINAVSFPVDVERVCFPPGCEQAIVESIGTAKSEILVQAYSFTSTPIAKALLNAHKRGVRVEVILDKSQRTQKYSSYTFFKNQGIPVYIDEQHAIAHNKIIIIDRAMVITGSYNFTKAAEIKNAENILFIKSPQLTDIYLKEWGKHRNHSE